MERQRRRWLALVTLLGSSLLGLALAEAAIRQIYGEGFGVLLDAYEDHPYRPYLRYQLAWGDLRYPLYTNSLGWKDAALDRRVPRDPGEATRVVFLGDSFTEGLGFRQEATLSGVAGQILDRSGGRYEVLNGGRNSYSPLLEYQRLRRFLEAGYRTDYVVLLPDVSDPVDEVLYGARYEFGPRGEPLRFQEPFYGPLVRGIYNRSALARSLRSLQKRLAAGPASSLPGRQPVPLPAVGTFTPRQFLALPPEVQMALRPNWPLHPPSLRGWAGQGLRSMLVNMERIRRLTAARSIRLIVAIYPWPTMLYTREDPHLYARLARRFPAPFRDRELVYGRGPGPRLTPYETALRDFCQHRSIPLVDLISEVQVNERWEDLFLRGDVHFNEQGNRLAGMRIAAAILAEVRKSPARSR
jgi:lysophospholipase L1-like esterase